MISEDNPWILPDGLEEALPASARRLEDLRRRILDQFDLWGYDLVIPPMAEFLDSLLTGTGRELELQTFKLTDQISGKLLGIRADLTPQVARIDAHRLREEGTRRLCYVGSVLRTRPDEWSRSRSPMQAGAELFGHDGLDSDVEIIRLMLATLAIGGLSHASIDLGHVGVYRELARIAGLDDAQERLLFGQLQRKAVPEIEQTLAQWNLHPDHLRWLRGLVDLNGGIEVLTLAQSVLAGAPKGTWAAIEHLVKVVTRLQSLQPDLDIHVDLGELRGYSYHTGLVFAAFVPASGQEIARGGRYNDVGRIFGNARAATGFSTDLRTLLALAPGSGKSVPTCVLAPATGAPGLEEAISSLRAQGVRVRRILAGETLTDLPALPDLRWLDGRWQVVMA